MNDPLAQLVAAMLTDVEGVPFAVEDCTECGLWLRAHRDELLTALGGDCRDANTSSVAKGTAQTIPIIVDMEPGESVWVFGEDA